MTTFQDQLDKLVDIAKTVPSQERTPEMDLALGVLAQAVKIEEQAAEIARLRGWLQYMTSQSGGRIRCEQALAGIPAPQLIRSRRGCPDGGTCHHGCMLTECFRVRACGPLSGTYPQNEWPPEIKVAFGG